METWKEFRYPTLKTGFSEDLFEAMTSHDDERLISAPNQWRYF